MEDERRAGDEGKVPATVVNGTRVTVAFPFSNIALQEPTTELNELAAIVAGLAELVAESHESDRASDLRSRAAAIRDALNGATRPR
jgi:hypothetical protein